MTTTRDPYATATPMPWLEPGAPTAACAEVDADSWFPDGGAARSREATAAARICDRCPLQAACLDWSVREMPEFGIFGGLSPRARRQLRRRRAA